MAEEKKLEIPDDLKARLKKLSEASNIKPATLMKKLREIFDTDEKIKVMEKEEFKIRYAVARLLKEQVSTGQTTDFYVKPLLHFNYREINTDAKYVGDFSCLLKKIVKDENGKIVEGETEFGAGTLWRDAAKQLEKLEKGKIYKASFIAEKTSWGWSLGGNNAGFVEVDGIEFPALDEFYKKEIEPMNVDTVLSDLDMETSQTPTDIKVLNVRIIDSDIRERPNKTEYGYYDINDDSFIGNEKGVQGQRLFLDPRDVEYEMGCDIKVGVNIAVRNDKVQLTPYFILPVGEVQKKIFTDKDETPRETVSAEDLVPDEDDEDDFGTI